MCLDLVLCPGCICPDGQDGGEAVCTWGTQGLCFGHTKSEKPGNYPRATEGPVDCVVVVLGGHVRLQILWDHRRVWHSKSVCCLRPPREHRQGTPEKWARSGTGALPASVP